MKRVKKKILKMSTKNFINIFSCINLSVKRYIKFLGQIEFFSIVQENCIVLFLNGPVQI